MRLTADVVAEQSTDGVYAMATQWFVKIGDKHAGPFTAKQVKEMARSGQITPNSHLCKGQNGEPTGQWALATRIRGLFTNEDQKISVSSKTDNKQTKPSNDGQALNKIGVNVKNKSSVLKRQTKTEKNILSIVKNKSEISVAFLITLGLLICFPIGLFLLWNSRFSLKTKIVSSCVFFLLLICISGFNRMQFLQKEERSRLAQIQKNKAEQAQREKLIEDIDNDPKAFVGEETWKLVQKHLPLTYVRENNYGTSYGQKKILKLDEYFDVTQLADDRFLVKGEYEKEKFNRVTMIDGESFVKSYSYEYTAEVDYIGQGKFRLERVTSQQYGQLESGGHPRLTYVRKGARPSVTASEAESTQNRNGNKGKDHPGHIGKWQDSILGIISIIQQGGDYFLVFKDGSRMPLKKSSARAGKSQFVPLNSDTGDYYLINAAGDLESWDSQGHISTATKR